MKYIIDHLPINAETIERLALLPVGPDLVDAAKQLVALKSTLEALGVSVEIELAPLEIEIRQPKGFSPLHRYWLETYPVLNPFSGGVYCPRCHFPPAFESKEEMINPATGVTKFKCICGHEFDIHKTYD